jgi:DNA-binding transcriptional ArsR family regulator
MKLESAMTSTSGDRMLLILAALASPHRLRIVERLHVGGRNYISRLAREVGLSRPLLHLHLRKLEDAGLVTSRFELSSEGKALNVFELADFAVDLTPSSIALAARTLTAQSVIPQMEGSQP